MFKITMRQAKGSFFDREAVLKAADAATRKALSRAGAMVRSTARQSIRKRKKVSAPGQPPSSHTGKLRNFILFSYDRSNQSVVVGPARLTGTVDPDTPRALEYGGTTNIYAPRGKRVRAKIRPRPFMGPALERERPNLAQLWRNSIR